VLLGFCKAAVVGREAGEASAADSVPAPSIRLNMTGIGSAMMQQHFSCGECDQARKDHFAENFAGFR